MTLTSFFSPPDCDLDIVGPEDTMPFLPSISLITNTEPGFRGADRVSWQVLVHFTHLPPPGAASAH